jgi:spermidine synthase
MKKHELLDSATTPDGNVLTLHRHDGAYTINVDGIELMSSRRHASEDVLAELVCNPLLQRNAPSATVLIGGLGLGFTLRAALRSLPADARVVIVEIMAEVIRWNQNPEYEISTEALRDPRVELLHADVADVVNENPARFDGIMLDLDNGAEGMTTESRALLYRADGIRRAAAALRSGGLLAYWSLEPHSAFEHALRAAGLDVAMTRVRAHTTAGPRHSIYVCSKRSAPLGGHD